MGEIEPNSGEVDKGLKLFNLIVNKIKKSLDYFLGLFHGEKPIEIVYLPISVRLAIAHNNSILSKREILDLLNPKFGLLGVWLVLKFYEDNRDIFFEIFERIVRDLSNNTESIDIWTDLHRKLSEDVSEKHLKTSGKISFVARMGFVEFCDALGNLYFEREGYDYVVLVANSGLMGLQTIIPKLKRDQGELIILFPKLSKESHLYLVSFKTGKLVMRFLNENESSEKIREQKLLVIDDVSSTGETEKQVKEILSPFVPSGVDFRTLIKFPTRRH